MKFAVFSLISREFRPETGSLMTGSSASREHLGLYEPMETAGRVNFWAITWQAVPGHGSSAPAPVARRAPSPYISNHADAQSAERSADLAPGAFAPARPARVHHRRRADRPHFRGGRIVLHPE